MTEITKTIDHKDCRVESVPDTVKVSFFSAAEADLSAPCQVRGENFFPNVGFQDPVFPKGFSELDPSSVTDAVDDLGGP